MVAISEQTQLSKMVTWSVTLHLEILFIFVAQHSHTVNLNKLTNLSS